MDAIFPIAGELSPLPESTQEATAAEKSSTHPFGRVEKSSLKKRNDGAKAFDPISPWLLFLSLAGSHCKLRSLSLPPPRAVG